MQSYLRAELPPVLAQYRTTNMLADIAKLPKPPKIEEVVKSGALDINNIQHDILTGKLKPKQQYNFFTVEDVKMFKTVLRTNVCPLITPVAQMIGEVEAQPQVALNIAFSQTGLNRLGVTDNLQDTFFSNSQFADAEALGDPGTENWKPAFKAPSALHGMFLAASDKQDLIDAMVAYLKHVFGSSITMLYEKKGSMRPDQYAGHEMFGFVDGISQPAVEGYFTDPYPGQLRVPPGIILVGEPGDTISSRPAWAKDGSFLAFRELQQLVPEFDAFLEEKAVDVPGLTRQESIDLLGARMFGRWKSGAPVALSPLRDDPELATDKQKNNDFTFAFPDEDIMNNQSRCPFHAHIRKSRPRADLISPEHPVEQPTHGIMRSSIPYGDEVYEHERDAKKSDPAHERGLVFVSYQSQLEQGFRFLQIPWSNDPDFARHKHPAPGYDPIVGQNHGQPRKISGYDVLDSRKELILEHDFVVSRGGEYLFSPSLSALHDVISA